MTPDACDAYKASVKAAKNGQEQFCGRKEAAGRPEPGSTAPRTGCTKTSFGDQELRNRNMPAYERPACSGLFFLNHDGFFHTRRAIISSGGGGLHLARNLLNNSQQETFDQVE